MNGQRRTIIASRELGAVARADAVDPRPTVQLVVFALLILGGITINVIAAILTGLLIGGLM